MVVILLTASMVQLLYMAYLDINPESILVKEFKDSQTEFIPEFDNAIYWTYDFVENYQNYRGLPEDIDYVFYVKGDGIETTNSKTYTKEFFSSFKDAFFSYENGVITLGDNTNPSVINNYPMNEKITVYIAFPDDYMEEQQIIWESGRAKLIPLAISMVAYLLFSLALIIYLIIVTGKKPDDDTLHYSAIDNLYSEILFLAYIPLFALWILVVSKLPNYPNYNNLEISGTQVYNLIAMTFVTGFVTIFSGILLLSIVRKIKGRKLFKSSIIYKVFRGINDFIRSLFDGRRFGVNPLTKTLHQRQVIFIGASFIFVFLTFLFLITPPLMLIPPILEAILIYWYIKYNNETYQEINKGFNESLQEQMKSERMKIDLVTNVSHDLKTPLTSIISYVDLLSKEEELSETARDYVNILAEKSNRLKNIVSDLFDLAKSTSGDINLDFESIDLKKLIEQTIGDMEDNIEKSGMQLKTKLPDSPTNIFSDGKKLYRVFQNIIDNALKYSLKGTRIFVDLEEINGKALATIKNTAGYEMDFSSQDILQRFNRGDKSRTTDGSGLGLSIAESFTNVCGGNFKIGIDGDMFKVIISFDLI